MTWCEMFGPHFFQNWTRGDMLAMSIEGSYFDGMSNVFIYSQSIFIQIALDLLNKQDSSSKYG